MVINFLQSLEISQSTRLAKIALTFGVAFGVHLLVSIPDHSQALEESDFSQGGFSIIVLADLDISIHKD